MNLQNYLEERTLLSERNQCNLKASNPHEKIVLDIIRDPSKLEIKSPLELFVRVPIVNHLNDKFVECCPDLIGIGQDGLAVIVTVKYAEHHYSRTKAMNCLFTQLTNSYNLIKLHHGIGPVIRGVYREGRPTREGFEVLDINQLNICRMPVSA